VHDIRQLAEAQERKDEQHRYKRRARLLAAIMSPTWFPEYDPTMHELDHKFSLTSGYNHHVPLEVISSKANLQLLSPEENRRKGKKCSIDMEELLHEYRPDPFVARVAVILRRMPLWKLKKASIRISRRLRELREGRQQNGEDSRRMSVPPCGDAVSSETVRTVQA